MGSAKATAGPAFGRRTFGAEGRIVKLFIGQYLSLLRIGRPDLSTAAKREMLALIKIHRSLNIAGNGPVVGSDAIHLHCKKHGYVALSQRSSKPDGGLASKALAENNHAGIAAFRVIQLVVSIRIQSLFHQFWRDFIFVIFDGFGIDAGDPPQIDYRPPDSPILVVPMFPTAEEANY